MPSPLLAVCVTSTRHSGPGDGTRSVSVYGGTPAFASDPATGPGQGSSPGDGARHSGSPGAAGRGAAGTADEQREHGEIDGLRNDRNWR